jgi:N-acetylglucosaminyl-diphospho-decaprenol L-rhamnosyltransferase
MEMHVAISIVGFRNAGDIVECLAALEASTHADFEVVICENGGPAAFADLTARLPHALRGGQPVRAVLAPGNLGYAGGVNTCLREAPGADAWWVLNPDTKPYPETLARLVQRLEVGDCEVVGGTIHFPDGRVESHGGRWHAWLGRSESVGYGTSLDLPIDAAALEPSLSYFSGASLLVGRRFIETIGPMQEGYFLYCEEVEWCLRGRARGMRLGFAPGALVLHKQGTTTGSVSDIQQRGRMPVFLDERNKILVTRDCFPSRLPVAASAALVLLLLRFGRRGAWRQLGYGLEGWLAGLFNQRGAPRWLSV